MRNWHLSISNFQLQQFDEECICAYLKDTKKKRDIYMKRERNLKLLLTNKKYHGSEISQHLSLKMTRVT